MTADKKATPGSASVVINVDERGLHADLEKWLDGLRRDRALGKIIGE